ncbi:MAG: hypothetical protein NT033_09850 [Candidatus Omnitrophica bacterium]|nr:hypothetical protein [Candidatus Omnitrophota bacterium]
MRYKTILIVALLTGILVIALAQFSIPTLFDADGYYHIRMAKIIRQYGINFNFHWARYSIFTEHFADKDFLYHLLIIPFTFMSNIFLGAKIAAVVFASALYLVYFWLLRRWAKRQLIIPFLGIFFLAPLFLIALSRPRPMILMIALTLLFVHFLIQRNWRALIVITVVYRLTHFSGPFLFLFALICETVRFVDEKKWEGKNLLAVAAGVVIGVLVHPHFPNNLLVFYLNAVLVPMYALNWGLELGAEGYLTKPIDPEELLVRVRMLVRIKRAEMELERTKADFMARRLIFRTGGRAGGRRWRYGNIRI